MDHGAWACPMPAVVDEVSGPGRQVRGHRNFLRSDVVRETRMRIDCTCFTD
jgi:hypothetical protein